MISNETIHQIQSMTASSVRLIKHMMLESFACVPMQAIECAVLPDAGAQRC